MYWTLVQCATGEILLIRIYGFYPVYPIGNTPNNDKTVLTYAMRKVVDNHRMQYVLLNVMYSTLVLCATGEILSLFAPLLLPTFYPFGTTTNNDMIV